MSLRGPSLAGMAGLPLPQPGIDGYYMKQFYKDLSYIRAVETPKGENRGIYSPYKITGRDAHRGKRWSKRFRALD
jgi:hypothetical protein